ncbi:MAG: hypothetical protein KDE51_05120, partial [Anaerolineales bacterium]|nr:hypothetical protein [Anaerolineales bacterium]
SAVQMLKLRARFLWRVSFKLLLGRCLGLQNGLKLPRFLLFGTTQLGSGKQVSDGLNNKKGCNG